MLFVLFQPLVKPFYNNELGHIIIYNYQEGG
jgi:hypothetical protein